MDLKLSEFGQLFVLNLSNLYDVSILETIYVSTYISSYKCRYANSNYLFCSYLDCLPCLEERLVRIGHVLQRDPVELALINVRYSVILAALRRADRRLQVVLKSVIRETKGQTNKIPEMRRGYVQLRRVRAVQEAISLVIMQLAVSHSIKIESRLLNRQLRARKRMLN